MFWGLPVPEIGQPVYCCPARPPGFYMFRLDFALDVPFLSPYVQWSCSVCEVLLVPALTVGYVTGLGLISTAKPSHIMFPSLVMAHLVHSAMAKRSYCVPVEWFLAGLGSFFTS